MDFKKIYRLMKSNLLLEVGLKFYFKIEVMWEKHQALDIKRLRRWKKTFKLVNKKRTKEFV